MRWLICLSVLLSMCAGLSSLQAQSKVIEPEFGIVFFLPDTTEQAIAQLTAFHSQGFNSIKIPSWAWTIPKPGSDLERNITAILDWCDDHHMKVWLLENIQYGSVTQGGDLDRVQSEPLYKRKVLEPWLDLLKNRTCFQGMLLGNEVRSVHLDKLTDANPEFYKAFKDYLLKTHGDLNTFNLRWKSNIKDFQDLPALEKDDTGYIDFVRFSYSHFALMYDTWFEQCVKPELGVDKLYGSKTHENPYLQRACKSFTVCSWDDLLANIPPHVVQLMVDTVQQMLGRPVFNSEIHLYHDKRAFASDTRLTRYRYMMSAVQGEWKTASFDNKSWTKDKCKVQHQAAIDAIAEVKRLEPMLRQFNDRTKAPIAMLVTEGNMRWSPNPDIPNEGPEYGVALAYPWLASLGHSWRYVLDQDLDKVTIPQTLIISSPWLTAPTIEALKKWPAEVQMIAIGTVPNHDEWHVLLPLADRQWLRSRIRTVDSWESLCRRIQPVKGLPAAATEVIMGRLNWWAKGRGSYRIKYPFPQLEVRHLITQDKELVLLVTHDRDADLSVDLPWVNGATVIEHTGNNPGKSIDPKAIQLGPNALRLFEYKN